MLGTRYFCGLYKKSDDAFQFDESVEGSSRYDEREDASGQDDGSVRKGFEKQVLGVDI
jgi:hypothetical protein